jgi:hypothetical protein
VKPYPLFKFRGRDEGVFQWASFEFYSSSPPVFMFVGAISKIKLKYQMASQPALDTLLTSGYLPTLLNKLLMTVRAANSLPTAADYSFHQMDEQFAGTLRRLFRINSKPCSCFLECLF